MTDNNKTPDTKLSERVAKGVERRDAAKMKAVRIQAEVDLAQKSADAARVEAQTEYGVSTLQELREKAEAIYRKELADVELFENEVAKFEKAVLDAERILSEVNA